MSPSATPLAALRARGIERATEDSDQNDVSSLGEHCQERRRRDGASAGTGDQA